MTQKILNTGQSLKPLFTSPRGSRGSVLIMALLMATIIFMLAVSFTTMVTLESKTVSASDDANIAFYCADAGLQRSFVELVNFTPGTAPLNIDVNDMYLGTRTNVTFDDTGIYTDSTGRTGQYKSTIYANIPGKNIADYNTIYSTDPAGFGVVTAVPGDFGARGIYRYIFTIESQGTVLKTGNVISRRTIVAKVLIERPVLMDNSEYQGYGKIQYWYEKYR
jgi:hypothetical protein